MKCTGVGLLSISEKLNIFIVFIMCIDSSTDIKKDNAYHLYIRVLRKLCLNMIKTYCKANSMPKILKHYYQ